jgi:Co/Zn/Cd efflux system component
MCGVYKYFRRDFCNGSEPDRFQHSRVESDTCFVMLKSLNQAVRLVAILNLAYFGVEFAVALHIGSVSLFADSIDFLEDASVNFLILFALTWSAKARARVGMALACILLVPDFATLWMAWHKFTLPFPPAPAPLSATALGALVINLSCAFMLARFRDHSGSLSRAAFLSASGGGRDGFIPLWLA